MNGGGSGDGNESSSGDGNRDVTRTGSGRAEERRRSARNRTGVVDAMRKTGETWLGGWREKKRRQESVSAVTSDPDNLENNVDPM